MLALKNSPVHGTAVAVGGQGFLILGPSGVGKSGLALNMIALGATLVADDQVVLLRTEDRVKMSAPAPLLGKIEARHVGFLQTDHRQNVKLTYVVDLTTESAARLPEPQTCDVMGLPIALLCGRNVPNLASVLCVLGRGARVE